MPWSQWLWKPALLAALYVFVYIVFGLFVFRPIAGFLDLKVPENSIFGFLGPNCTWF